MIFVQQVIPLLKLKETYYTFLCCHIIYGILLVNALHVLDNELCK